MTQVLFPTIDLRATGENIVRLRKSSGLSVRELQQYFGFEEPQAIYKWQQGKCLPSVDNLFALSCLLGVSMNDILVQTSAFSITNNGQSDDCPLHFSGRFRHNRITELQIIFAVPYEYISIFCKEPLLNRINQVRETNVDRMKLCFEVLADIKLSVDD